MGRTPTALHCRTTRRPSKLLTWPSQGTMMGLAVAATQPPGRRTIRREEEMKVSTWVVLQIHRRARREREIPFNRILSENMSSIYSSQLQIWLDPPKNSNKRFLSGYSSIRCP